MARRDDRDGSARAVAKAPPRSALKAALVARLGSGVEPICPVYDDCKQAGTARRSVAIKKNKDNEGCTTTRYKRSGWLELSLAAMALAVARRRKKR